MRYRLDGQIIRVGELDSPIIMRLNSFADVERREELDLDGITYSTEIDFAGMTEVSDIYLMTDFEIDVSMQPSEDVPILTFSVSDTLILRGTHIIAMAIATSDAQAPNPTPANVKLILGGR